MITSSWSDPRTETTVDSAFWFSDMTIRICWISCRVFSSLFTFVWTCCNRTSSIFSVRWMMSSWGIDSSWICAGPPLPAETAFDPDDGRERIARPGTPPGPLPGRIDGRLGRDWKSECGDSDAAVEWEWYSGGPVPDSVVSISVINKIDKSRLQRISIVCIVMKRSARPTSSPQTLYSGGILTCLLRFDARKCVHKLWGFMDFRSYPFDFIMWHIR